MRVFNMEQRSPEWYKIRLGVITASSANNVLVAGYRSTYLYQLLAEIATGEPTTIPVTTAMQWGIDHEDEARKLYEKTTNTKVQQVGFCKPDDNDFVGCSPDGLLGEDGYLEIKCPFNPAYTVQYLSGRPKLDYVRQCQFGLMITGRRWADLVVFDPRMPDNMKLHITKLQRDEEVITELKQGINKMLKSVQEFTNKYNIKQNLIQFL